MVLANKGELWAYFERMKRLFSFSVCHKAIALGAWVLMTLFAPLAFGLNPIHTSTYAAFPSGLSQGTPSLHVAAIVPNGGGSLFLPIGLSLALGRDIEVGGSLHTHWGNGGDAFGAMVFGVQGALRSNNTIGLHLLIDAHGGDANGLTLNFHHHGGFSRRLSTETELRLGFLDGLAYDNALFALEGEYVLRVHASGPVSLQGGVIASSQTRHFNDFFALDLEPGVHVATGRKSALEALITMGLAGEHREGFRVSFAWIQAF